MILLFINYTTFLQPYEIQYKFRGVNKIVFFIKLLNYFKWINYGLFWRLIMLNLLLSPGYTLDLVEDAFGKNWNDFQSFWPSRELFIPRMEGR